MSAGSLVNRAALVSIVAIAALGSLGAFGALASCREATQITVTIESDVPGCGVYTQVTAGKVETLADASTTSSHDGGCTAPNRIGNVVLTPSTSRDAPIAFQVTTTLEDGGTIVARRALRFVEHSSPNVIVTMRDNCVTGASPRCEASDHTCVQGKCVSALCEGECLEKELTKRSSVFEDGGDAGAPTDNCGGWAGVQERAPWPMEGRCKTHPRRSRLSGPRSGFGHTRIDPAIDAGPPPPATRWFDPIIDVDGNVFIVTGSTLRRISGPLGTEPAGDRLTLSEPLRTDVTGSGVIADDGAAYFPTAQGLYRYDPSSAGDAGTAIPSGGAGIVGFNVTATGALIGFNDASIQRLDRSGRAAIPAFPASGPLFDHVIPAIDDARIFFGSGDGIMYLLLSDAGSAANLKAVGDDLNAVPALSTNWFLAAGTAVSRDGGSVVKRQTDAGDLSGSVVAIDADQTVVVCDPTNKLVRKLASNDLSEIARWPLSGADGGGAFCGKPTIEANGVIYVAWGNWVNIIDPPRAPVAYEIVGLNQAAHGDTSIVVRRDGALIVQGPGGVFQLSGLLTPPP